MIKIFFFRLSKFFYKKNLQFHISIHNRENRICRANTNFFPPYSSISNVFQSNILFYILPTFSPLLHVAWQHEARDELRWKNAANRSLVEVKKIIWCHFFLDRSKHYAFMATVLTEWRFSDVILKSLLFFNFIL